MKVLSVQPLPPCDRSSLFNSGGAIATAKHSVFILSHFLDKGKIHCSNILSKFKLLISSIQSCLRICYLEYIAAFTVKHPRDNFPRKRVESMFYFQDDSGPSASDVTLQQFVSESETQMIVHLQPVFSTSRTNLLAPTKPITVRARLVPAPARRAVAPVVPAEPPATPAKPAAASGYNFVWQNFRGIEQNPNGAKHFLGDRGPSREANATNSTTEHFSLFINQNVIHSSAWKLTGMQIRIELLGFKMLVCRTGIAWRRDVILGSV